MKFAKHRTMDSLGRIVIPQEFREQLGLQPGDELLFSCDRQTQILHVQKRTAVCFLCGATEQLKPLPKGWYVCPQCLTDIK